MSEVNVENIDEQMEMFESQMGFPANSPGLDLTDEQLVNFMILCHKAMLGGDEEEEYEEYEEEATDDPKIKVKVVKMRDDDVRNMMDDMLGHGGPKLDY